ncbi:MAG: helix-turn-helix domain-containing protein [Actinomycetota bacterium]|nr:helix-turn-helix domain-containing protein [Actinomycetota bacterium]
MPVGRSRNHALATAFGARLREVRHARGLSQEALAHAASLYPTYISNCERGYSAPTLETLLRLAAALEVMPSALVDDLEY